MLLLLHGLGSDERDLFSLCPAIDPRFHVLSLRGPYSLGQGGYSWFETQFAVDGSKIRAESAEASRQKLIQFIQQASTHYHTDPQRVFLMGFSQGAILGLLMALTRPDMLGGVIALSGSLPGEILASSSPVTRQLAGREMMGGFPIFLGHGTQDDVIKIEEGQRVRDRLMSLQANVFYREYETGHAVPRQVMSDLDIWLSGRLIARV
jgi:phospholipase/carboxylesterase